jgi:HEAT repeat protein
LTLILALWSVIIPAQPAELQTRRSPSSLERDALTAFRNAHYDGVIRILEAFPQGQNPSRELLRLGLQSYLRLGQPEAALTIYGRLVPPGQQDNPLWLHEVARSFITSKARDPEEYVRIALYTALSEIAGRDVVPLLQDGLLDASILVRARAAEGLGRALQSIGRAGAVPLVSALKQALQDPAAAVRIAALNALGNAGDRKDPSTLEAIARAARVEEGAVHVFASAALVKLGRSDALGDIISAATLPDPDARMAAIGVLGRLRRPSSLSVLTQSVYDPDTSVRAFGAGALGEFGDPAAGSALTHALGDESPRVRAIAAASLGRLGLAQHRSLLRQAARDPDELVRAGAIEGLLRLNAGTRCSRPAATKRNGHPTSHPLQEAKQCVPGNGSTGEVILFAADLAKHPAPSVRSAAAQALGLSGNKTGLSVLEPLLQDQQPQPRLAAVRALGKIGGRSVIPLLKKALQDTDPAIRITAGGGLVQVLSKEATQEKR